ncbi:MAG: dihydroneopterin aldolase [Gammaproteobacteria bacterium]
MDKVFVHDLKVMTTVGAYSWEQAIKQTIYIDYELQTDASRASKTDQLNETIDYTAIADRIVEDLADYRCTLVETLAEHIAEIILNEFAVTWLRLTIRKPGIIPAAKEVGIVIERSSSEC